MFSLTRLKRYGISLAGVLVLTVLRLALDPLLGAELPLFLYVFPIVVAAWYGGLWPGLMATFLSLLLGNYLFIPKHDHLSFMRAMALGFIGTTFSILLDRTRKANRAYLECLERFCLFVDSTNDYAMFTLDPRGHVASWNTGAERIAGYREKDVMGRDFSMLYPSEDVENGKPQKALQLAAGEGRYEEEGWQRRKDGSLFWASGVISPLRDSRGELRGFAKITRDMTSRRLADDTLRESQRFVRHIVDTSPSVIFVYDLRQKKNVFVSSGFATALGYSPDQDSQDAEFIRSLIHPDDRQPLRDHMRQLGSLKNDETADCEYRIRQGDGTWRWFHSRHKVFSRNEDGSVHEIIGTATDITDRKIGEGKSRFIDDLNQALLPLADPDQIMAVTVKMLGKFLDVDRCGYAEIDQQDHFIVRGDYVRDETPSIVGRYPMAEFGDHERMILRENQPYVVNDIEAEAPAGTELSIYRRAQIRALVCVPLNKAGGFMARMAVHQNKPRYWSSDEINLITTVANRCWESVERAKALRSVKESDERYRAFIANSSEAIWRFELEQPFPPTLPEDEQIEMLYQSAYLAECNDAMAQMYGYDKADEIVGARLGQLLVKSDPHNIAFLRAFRQAGYRLADAESREVDRYGNAKYFLNNLAGIQENGLFVRGWGTQRDITSQKQAEQALRESEERYRLLTELSPAGVVIAGADGTIHLANPSTLRMFGAPAERVNGRNFFDFVAPESLGECRHYLSSVIANGKPATHVEGTFRSEDGQTLPVEFSAVHFEEKGEPLAQIVIYDLSVRKQAQAERERLLADIEAERNRLTQILQQMPIGVAIAEAPSGRVLFNNLEAVRLLRHTLLPTEDYKGYEQYGAVHEDGRSYRAEEYPMWRSLFLKDVIKGEEMRYRRGDGTDTMFAVDAAPVYDSAGRMVLAVVTFIDIADRKAAVRALSESEERFARAFEASPDALLISRVADGVILEANDSFVSISGYDRDELIGKSTLGLDLYMDPADRERAVAMLKQRNRVRDLEFAMKRRSGEKRLILFSAETLDLHGEHCWLTIGRDITERKQVEKERERLLLQEKAAREEAEAANQLKDEFLATMSHELRTPLTSILGWARMLTNGSLSESQTRHAHRAIEQGAESQARLVDDILDTARIITGRFKLDAQPLEVERVFLAAVDVIRPTAEAKGITLRVVVDDHNGLIRGDADRLQQVIWNLLSNAVKFTYQGGRVEARLSRSGNQIEISVTDSGIGIEPKFMPYLFNRFRQADSTSTRKYGGLGLGLAIVRHVVEMHGGTVSASSAGKGHGSTFTIRFPDASAARPPRPEVRPEPRTRQPVERTEDRQKLRGLRLLVVEDDRDTLDMLSFVFQENGAEVITAASASEALTAMDRLRPHVVVSDLAMPGQDGYELITKIRSRTAERGGNVPAVALSSYTRPEDRSRALAAGFQVHVSKPVDPNRLVAVVASLTGVLHS
jgi:PAS domain S-box-containing protein